MKIQAFARLMEQTAVFTELANSHAVRDLAKRIFGQDCEFYPQELYQVDMREPRMWVLPKKPWTEQQLKYFDVAMSRNPTKYRVNYVLPDTDKGPLALQVVFFKDFTPIR